MRNGSLIYILIIASFCCGMPVAMTGPKVGLKPGEVVELVCQSWLTIERAVAGTVIKDPEKLDGTSFLKDGYSAWPRRGELSATRGGTIHIDASTIPTRLDFVTDERGSGTEKYRNVMPNIFKFDGDKLVIAYGKTWVKQRILKDKEDYEGRPTEFKSTKENGLTIEIMKPCNLFDQD